MSQSEVARLQQQIEAECIAAHRGLNAFASVARHEIITNRYNRVGVLTDQLARHVGAEEANAISAQIYIQVSEEPLPQKDQEHAPQAEAEERAALNVDPSKPTHPAG